GAPFAKLRSAPSQVACARQAPRQPTMIGVESKRIVRMDRGGPQERRSMNKQALLAGGIIVAAIVTASLTLDGTTVPNRKIAGGSEACTYHAGPMDAE